MQLVSEKSPKSENIPLNNLKVEYTAIALEEHAFEQEKAEDLRKYPEVITVPKPPISKIVKKSLLVKDKGVTRRFRILGAYPFVQKALEARGWVLDSTGDPRKLDLLISTLVKNIDLKAVPSNQIVNHFCDISNFTLKSGLCKTLNSLSWEGIDISEFTPLTFCIPEESSIEHFAIYFVHFQVELLELL